MRHQYRFHTSPKIQRVALHCTLFVTSWAQHESSFTEVAATSRVRTSAQAQLLSALNALQAPVQKSFTELARASTQLLAGMSAQDKQSLTELAHPSAPVDVGGVRFADTVGTHRPHDDEDLKMHQAYLDQYLGNVAGGKLPSQLQTSELSTQALAGIMDSGFDNFKAHILGLKNRILNYFEGYEHGKNGPRSVMMGELHGLSDSFNHDSDVMLRTLSVAFVRRLHGVTGRCCCVPKASRVCRWHPSVRLSPLFSAGFLRDNGCGVLDLQEFGELPDGGVAAAQQCGSSMLQRAFFNKNKECHQLAHQECALREDCEEDNGCHRRTPVPAQSQEARAVLSSAGIKAHEEGCRRGIPGLKKALRSAHSAGLEEQEYTGAIALISACAEAHSNAYQALEHADAMLVRRSLAQLGQSYEYRVQSSVLELKKDQMSSVEELEDRSGPGASTRTVILGTDLPKALQAHLKKVLQIRNNLDQNSQILQNSMGIIPADWVSNADQFVDLWMKAIKLGNGNMPSAKIAWLMKPKTGLGCTNFEKLNHAYLLAKEYGRESEAASILAWLNRVTRVLGHPVTPETWKRRCLAIQEHAKALPSPGDNIERNKQLAHARVMAIQLDCNISSLGGKAAARASVKAAEEEFQVLEAEIALVPEGAALKKRTFCKEAQKYEHNEGRPTLLAKLHDEALAMAGGEDELNKLLTADADGDNKWRKAVDLHCRSVKAEIK